MSTTSFEMEEPSTVEEHKIVSSYTQVYPLHHSRWKKPLQWKDINILTYLANTLCRLSKVYLLPTLYVSVCIVKLAWYGVWAVRKCANTNKYIAYVILYETCIALSNLQCSVSYVMQRRISNEHWVFNAALIMHCWVK